MSNRQDAGNTAAIREALEYLCSISDLDLRELEVLGKRLEDASTYGGGLVLKLVHGVRNGQKTLAKPPRACDLMTEEELSRVVSRSIVASVSSRPELNEEWIKSLVDAAATAAIKCAYDTELKSNKEANNDEEGSK